MKIELVDTGKCQFIRIWFQPCPRDFVEYDDNPPWPMEADGGGETLELKHPSMDNANWENWSASEGYGTPGALNSVYSDDI